MIMDRKPACSHTSGIVGNCPECGRDVVEGDKRYDCVGGALPRGQGVSFEAWLRARCLFGLYKDCLRHVGKAVITPAEMGVLLTGNPIPLPNLFTKDGRSFDTHGILSRHTGRWGIKFVRASQKSGLVRRLIREQRKAKAS